ncbi:MAG TPA: DUF4421 family protein [Brumimicrobium sp.]|nr:DUF4421 family protein [Brumimicrobium sp.]
MKAILFIVFLFFLSGYSYSQKDSLAFAMHKNRLVIHTSISLRDAPFSFKDDFDGVKKLGYRANLNVIHGFGVAYKWFALNINYKLPGYVRNTEKYGRTKYFDLGLKFSFKQWYFNVDFHDYIGYGIKKANTLSDTLPTTTSGYYLNDKIQSASFGVNAYHFFNKDLNMKAAVGIVGRYTKPVHGPYIRLTSNIHGVSSNNGLIPHEYFTSTPSIHKSTSISAFDFGGIPGYAYLNNIDGWQFGAFAGIGAVIQAKVYSFENTQRSFLGISPRIDLKLQAGYNVENWFLMLTSSFDQKNIRVKSFSYNQLYYYLRLTYGYRFKIKTKNKSK